MKVYAPVLAIRHNGQAGAFLLCDNVGDRLILRALRESSGLALAVTDEEMVAGQLALARGEGIFPAPKGGATVAAAKRLVELDLIAADERVVLFNTGSGLKYPDIPGLRVP